MIHEEICTVYLHLKKKSASGCLTFTEQITGVVASHTTALTPIHAPVLCKLPSTCISKHHPYIDITSCFVVESFLFGQHGIHLLSHYMLESLSLVLASLRYKSNFTLKMTWYFTCKWFESVSIYGTRCTIDSCMPHLHTCMKAVVSGTMHNVLYMYRYNLNMNLRIH